MFGKNPRRRADTGDGLTLHVQDVFGTLQGEGPFAGRPATFIRLAGCNLACWYCDTDFESSQWHPTLAELLARVPTTPPLVVLTGGEPLRQNVGPLLEALLACVETVQIETAGTLWPASLNRLEAAFASERIVLVCSPKTALVHRAIQRWCKHYKYIVGANDGAFPTESTQYRGRVAALFHAPDDACIWLQPRDDQDPVRNARNVRHAAHLCMQYGYRLSLQQHKIIGLP